MMDVALAYAWIRAAAAGIEAEADLLTRLDTAIGDGDHGVNMVRGFTAVLAALNGWTTETVGEVFVRTGTTLVSRVGGASGPLFGTAFRAIGRALPTPLAAPEEFGAALRAGLYALMKLGGAELGDKTIVDAYAPAVEAFAAALPVPGPATPLVGPAPSAVLAAAAAAAAAAAEAGARATIGLRARRGRASYLGERSIGHQDPGATSTWLIFRALERSPK